MSAYHPCETGPVRTRDQPHATAERPHDGPLSETATWPPFARRDHLSAWPDGDAWRDLNPGRLSEGMNLTQRAGYELTNPGNILR